MKSNLIAVGFNKKSLWIRRTPELLAQNHKFKQPQNVVAQNVCRNAKLYSVDGEIGGEFYMICAYLPTNKITELTNLTQAEFSSKSR